MGQQVTPGTNLVRIAEPRRLKAEIEVAATQIWRWDRGRRSTLGPGTGFADRPGREGGAGDR